jgi:hypothetical protein
MYIKFTERMSSDSVLLHRATLSVFVVFLSGIKKIQE